MKQLLFASALYVSTKNCSDDFITDSSKTPFKKQTIAHIVSVISVLEVKFLLWLVCLG